MSARCLPRAAWLMPVLPDGIEWEPGTWRVARDPQDRRACVAMVARRCVL